MRRFRTVLLATSALIPLWPLPAAANPLGPQVVAGSAIVQGQGTAAVTVTQQTGNAIINWNTFNIGAGEKTKIVMPSASSVELDRVTGGLGPSQIFGSLWSNGRVFLVNPDGILFGPGAKIDTGSFLGTTHDIANTDFMAGHYNFSIPGNPTASIVNQGTITAQTGGFAALVAPGVRNSGTITARLGTIALASGNGFTLDFYGDKLITLGLSDSIATTVTDVATGQPLSALVKNEGALKADGGRVELSAVAARQVVDSVINNTGVIEADSIGTKNGMIVLGAATAASKHTGAPTQIVKVSGTISAAGKNAGQTGGTIQITGEAIQLVGASIDASGRSGGGTVLIGGDVDGGNLNPIVASIPQAQLQPYSVPTAFTVTGDATATINASARDIGNGGKIVVWSDQSTLFDGRISVRGGAAFGNGGFVEASGHQSLSFNGTVSTGAPNGKRGTLLLDPQDVTIGSTGTWVVTVNELEAALASANVIVTTGSGPGNGDITVAEDVFWVGGSTLTLSAYRNIIFDASITFAGPAPILIPDNTHRGIGAVIPFPRLTVIDYGLLPPGVPQPPPLVYPSTTYIYFGHAPGSTPVFTTTGPAIPATDVFSTSQTSFFSNPINTQIAVSTPPVITNLSTVHLTPTGNSTPQLNIVPISQMSPSNYTDGTFQADSAQACLATVYTMVERVVQMNNTIPINNYYTTSDGAILPSNLTRGLRNDNLTSLQVGAQLLVIIGTAQTTTAGVREPHYMLATNVSVVGGKTVITAIDPYSGVQVTIDASTGHVVNPPSVYKQIDFQADAFRTLTVN